MLALVGPKSGFRFRRRISDKKSEKSVCFTPGFSPGWESSPTNQPALAEKPGETKPGEIPGLPVFTNACLHFAAFWAKAPGLVSSLFPPGSSRGW